MLPNFNRYTQVGNDVKGNPTGSQDGVLGRTKGWRELRAVGGNRAPQIAEWNELQSIFGDRIKAIGDLIKKDGQHIGLQVRTDLTSTPATATIEWADPNVPGQLYALGMLHVVPQVTLTISAADIETVAVRVVERVVTEEEDATFYDPITSEENQGNPGCYRIVYDVTPVIKNAANAASLTNTYDLWTLQDGDLRTSANDTLNEVDRNLIQYANDLIGNGRIRGMRTRVEDINTTQLRVTVDRGRALVQGREVGYDTTTSLTLNKAKFDHKTVQGELKVTETKLSGTNPIFETEYAPGSLPIREVTKLNALTLVKKRAGKTTFPFSQNPSDPFEIIISTDIPYGPLTDVISVYDIQAAAYISFTRTALGFRVSVIPTGDIRVVWVYNATLALDADYEVNSDKEALTFLRQYPQALADASEIVTGNLDRASWVYPGLSSTTVTSLSSSGQNLVTVGNTYGLVVGQKLYVGSTRNIAIDEQITIAEIVSSTVVRATTNLTTNHAIGQFVYVDPDFIGLTLTSSNYQLIVDYKWLLDRIDIVYIDADNQIRVQSGQSNRPAYEPPTPDGVLPIAKVTLSANGDAADTLVELYDNQIPTAQETRNVIREVQDIRYNLAIENIRTSTYNRSSAEGLTLRGMLTDALVNSDGVEINTTPAALKDLMIDPEYGVVSPKLTMDNQLLTVDTDESSCFIGNRAATLGHTLVVSNLVRNLVFTSSEVIRGLVNVPKPTLVVETGHYIGPADRADSFKFLNTNTRITETVPAELEGGFWRTRQTRVPWLDNQSLYLPAQTIKLTGRNFLAGSTYQVAIDGQVIGPLVATVTTAGVFEDINLVIPEQTVSGHNSRTISILDALGNPVAQTIMGATPSEAIYLPIAHDSLAAMPYVTIGQTFAFSRDGFFRGVNAFFATKGGAGSWVEVQVRDTDSTGAPGSIIYAKKRLLPADVSTTLATAVTFEDPIFCPANVPLALCFLSNTDDYAVKKAVVGKADTTGQLVTSRPLAQGALYTSTGSSWAIQTEASLTFELMECSFRADQNILTFNTVSPTGFVNVPMILARAQQLIPRGCAVDWSYSLNGNVAQLPVPLDINGTLDPHVLPQTATSIVLRAALRGVTQVSSVVGVTNARLLMFNPAERGVYVSRNPATLPAYSAVRLTLQLLTAAGTGTIKVKASTVLDPYGLAFVPLTGTVVSGDQLVLTVDGNALNFVYAPTGSPTLLDFATKVADAYQALYPAYTVTVTTAGAVQKLTIKRNNGEAAVSGDITAAATPAGGSTLAAQAPMYNYTLVPLDATVSRTVDEAYTEHTFKLTGIDSTPPAGMARTLRLRVELTTANVLAYPRARVLATLVSS